MPSTNHFRTVLLQPLSRSLRIRHSHFVYLACFEVFLRSITANL